MKTFFVSLAVFLGFLASLASMLFLILVDTSPMGKAEYLAQTAKLSLFRYAGVGKLDDREIELVYKGACTRKCHSRDVVERSAHSAREWEDIINRMGGINGARITKNEISLITSYLAKRYGSNIPTVLSEQGGRYLKKHLWRSDFGESDLYVDLIYTPVEYFKVVGGSSKVEGYGAAGYILFKVYLNTHQNKLDVYPLDKLAVLKTSSGREISPLLWKVVYDSSDFHHREGLLVFDKAGRDAASITVVLNDLPGQKERFFQWKLPIPESP
ncbi:MAG: hypothetical protein IMF07_04470 [Proteobacteria bacterium]|nr:hypothetical protein [Pseudomonadota bacterium]